MPLSQFTENYPRKFARQIIKIISKDKRQENNVHVGEDQGTTSEEHATKKRRLLQKLSPAEIARRFAETSWQQSCRLPTTSLQGLVQW